MRIIANMRGIKVKKNITKMNYLKFLVKIIKKYTVNHHFNQKLQILDQFYLKMDVKK